MKRSVSADTVREAARLAASYVHSCQTEDGGYFFARIPPGSLRDSYFAVVTLHVLGQQPRRSASLDRFVWSCVEESRSNNGHTLYLSSEMMRISGQPTDALRPRIQSFAESFEIADGVGNLDTLYVEVVSELEKTLEAVSLLVHSDIPFKRTRVVDFVLSLLNADGGFGRQGASTLATTYYAAHILSLIGYHVRDCQHILSFLKSQEERIYFLEDLYYLEATRSILGEVPWDGEPVVSFVLDCQRTGGGFARARAIGIPTLEYTCYAVALLKLLGTLES